MKILKTVQELIDGMVITSKTLDFIKKMLPSHGNMILRSEDNRSQLKGFLKLEDGSIIYLEGYIKQGSNYVTIPLRGVKLQEKHLDESKNRVGKLNFEQISNIFKN